MNWRRLFARRSPIERAIVQDTQAARIEQLEADNKTLRDRAEAAEAKATALEAQLAQARAHHDQMLGYIAQYRAANQDMWAQAAALGEAHATRDKMRLEAMLAHCAEVWQTQQARAESGRIH